MKPSPVRKRSIVMDGYKTSISVEETFWTVLKEIAAERKTTLSALVSDIDAARERSNLSSSVRQYVLAHVQEELRAERQRNKPMSVAA